jgi:hypothetical protein
LKYLRLIIALSLFTCCSSPRIVSRALPDNLTSYVFKVKIENANILFKKFYFTYHNNFGFYLDDIFFNGDSLNRIWSDIARATLKNEANKYDVCFELIEDSSLIYSNKKGKPFEYLMAGIAHFTFIDENTTKLEIQVLNAKVHIRDALLPSPPHFGHTPIYKQVKPTTIEEYKILQCFGMGLKVFNEMPVLKLPQIP